MNIKENFYKLNTSADIFRLMFSVDVFLKTKTKQSDNFPLLPLSKAKLIYKNNNYKNYGKRIKFICSSYADKPKELSEMIWHFRYTKLGSFFDFIRLFEEQRKDFDSFKRKKKLKDSKFLIYFFQNLEYAKNRKLKFKEYLINEYMPNIGRQGYELEDIIMSKLFRKVIFNQDENNWLLNNERLLLLKKYHTMFDIDVKNIKNEIGGIL